MNLVAVCAFALLAVFLTVTVKETQPRFGALIVTAAGIIFWIYAIKELLPLVQAMIGLTQSGAMGTSFAALFRALGLALVVSCCAGICRDLGESPTAEKLEFCGRIAILSLSLPVLKELIGAILKLLS